MFGFGITVDNVNEALPHGLRLLQTHGKPTASRGLNVIRVPGPVMTVYLNPTRRVLFDSVRDANPFFHLIESLWIIAGSNKVDLPRYFLEGIARFSDDGQTFHGAYGHRLRHAHGFDQIEMAIAVLKEKPDTRQVVLSIWHPQMDLGAVTKDVPCNDMLMFDIVEGKLNMTVCNRSNDCILGAYGANVVQFSMLQEFIAASVDVEVGVYVQQSNNFHVYEDNPFWVKYIDGETTSLDNVFNPYMSPNIHPYQLAIDPSDARDVMFDCKALCHAAESGDRPLVNDFYHSAYFTDVVLPMIRTYDLYKSKDFKGALKETINIAAPDWGRAAREWVTRRAVKAGAI